MISHNRAILHFINSQAIYDIMLFNVLFLVASLAGLGAASPYPPCQHHTICVDAINTCGVRYGA